MLILFNCLTLISIFLSAVLFFFFLFTKKGNRSENIILSSLLFLFSLQIAYSYMVSTYMFSYFMDWHREIFIIRQTSFLTGPAVYFYMCSLIKKDKLLEKKKIIHLIPFIVSVIIIISYYLTHEKFVIWKSEIDLYDTILILSHNLCYIVVSVNSLRSKDIESYNLKSISYSSVILWLKILLIGFIAIWVVNLNSFAIYMITQKTSWCAYTSNTFTLGIFLFMISILFLLLFKPDMYYVIEKYKTTPLDESTARKYLIELNDFMEHEKPFLDPNVSLKIIAKKLSINQRIISQIVNDSYGMNFKGYLNKYRIEESKRMLSEQNGSKKNILEIIYEAGFNSKSVFNHQFKKFTGMTPQEFRLSLKTDLVNANLKAD